MAVSPTRFFDIMVRAKPAVFAGVESCSLEGWTPCGLRSWVLKSSESSSLRLGTQPHCGKQTVHCSSKDQMTVLHQLHK